MSSNHFDIDGSDGCGGDAHAIGLLGDDDVDAIIDSIPKGREDNYVGLDPIRTSRT